MGTVGAVERKRWIRVVLSIGQIMNIKVPWPAGSPATTPVASLLRAVADDHKVFPYLEDVPGGGYLVLAHVVSFEDGGECLT